MPGTGESEWWLVAVFGLLAVIAALLARRDYLVNRRRLAGGESG
jgi:LPXTG-motif cell wall-anchored protein